MRRESIRQLFLLSVLVVIVFIYFIPRSLSYPIPELPTHAGGVDILVYFTEKPDYADQSLIQNAGGTASFQPAHGAEGASTPLPAALELRAEGVSDIIDDQGVFTRSVTIKSEDGKVQLDIAKGTKIKVPN